MRRRHTPSHKPILDRRASPGQVAAAGLINTHLFLSGVRNDCAFDEVHTTVCSVIQTVIDRQVWDFRDRTPSEHFDLIFMKHAESGDKSYKIVMSTPDLAHALTDWTLWPNDQKRQRPWSCTWFGAAPASVARKTAHDHGHGHYPQPADEESL